jgi:hypothetical protein
VRSTPPIRLTLPLIALWLATPGFPLHAQRSPGVAIDVVPGTATVAGPLVSAKGVLQDHRESINAAFSARLTYSVTLWRQTRWIDPKISDTSWTMIVDFSPMSRLYHIRVEVGTKRSVRGPFKSLEQVDSALAAPMEAPIVAPAQSSRMYYTVKLAIQPIEWNELDELGAWLGGEVAQAGSNPASPILGGIRRFFLGAIAGRGTSWKADSETFVPTPRANVQGY